MLGAQIASGPQVAGPPSFASVTRDAFDEADHPRLSPAEARGDVFQMAVVLQNPVFSQCRQYVDANSVCAF